MGAVKMVLSFVKYRWINTPARKDIENAGVMDELCPAYLNTRPKDLYLCALKFETVDAVTV